MQPIGVLSYEATAAFSAAYFTPLFTFARPLTLAPARRSVIVYWIDETEYAAMGAASKKVAAWNRMEPRVTVCNRV